MAANKILSLIVLVVAVSAIEHERIVGGIPAPIEYFSHFVSLRNNSDNEHFCGASIENWFITTALCAALRVSAPQNLSAWVGARNRTDGIQHQISEILLHPNFNWDFVQHNLALLRSATPVDLTRKGVAAVRLPKHDVRNGARLLVWIAGWGVAHSSTGDLIDPDVLLYKTVITTSREICRERLGSPLNSYVQENNLCTLDERGGSCRGDAGGSVTFLGRLVAIISMGSGCAGNPDVHLRLYPYLDFIRNATQI